MFRAGWLIYPGRRKEFWLSNSFQDAAEEAALKLIFRAVDTFGVTLYAGLCGNAVQDEALGLGGISDEIGVSNGYARKALTRNATDFNTIEQVTGFWRILSKEITFAAAGGDFDRAFTRMFLCNAASGSSGMLISFTSPLKTAKLLVSGESWPARYVIYAD